MTNAQKQIAKILKSNWGSTTVLRSELGTYYSVHGLRRSGLKVEECHEEDTLNISFLASPYKLLQTLKHEISELYRRKDKNLEVSLESPNALIAQEVACRLNAIPLFLDGHSLKAFRIKRTVFLKAVSTPKATITFFAKENQPYFKYVNDDKLIVEHQDYFDSALSKQGVSKSACALKVANKYYYSFGQTPIDRVNFVDFTSEVIQSWIANGYPNIYKYEACDPNLALSSFMSCSYSNSVFLQIVENKLSFGLADNVELKKFLSLLPESSTAISIKVAASKYMNEKLVPKVNQNSLFFHRANQMLIEMQNVFGKLEITNSKRIKLKLSSPKSRDLFNHAGKLNHDAINSDGSFELLVDHSITELDALKKLKQANFDVVSV